MTGRVVLGVSGGIAAYKACELLRRFTESGHDVTVAPPAAALRFVGAPTWAALSGKPVSTDVWDDVHEVPHVRIGQAAELVAVAPATAHMLAQDADAVAGHWRTHRRRPPGRGCAPAHPWSPSPPRVASPGSTPARAGCRTPTRSSRWPPT